MTPKQALVILQKAGNYDTRGKSQKQYLQIVKGYLRRQRRKTGAIFSSNVGSMLTWAKANTLADLLKKEGSNEHTVGVVLCKLTNNEPTFEAASADANADAAANRKKRPRCQRVYKQGHQRIILMFTTKNLLKNVFRQRDAWKKYDIDAWLLIDDVTHKINAEGLPLLAIGTADVNQLFHTAAVAVVSHEDEVWFFDETTM